MVAYQIDKYQKLGNLRKPIESAELSKYAAKAINKTRKNTVFGPGKHQPGNREEHGR